jgi:tyrosyl-tRNA synthetase
MTAHVISSKTEGRTLIKQGALTHHGEKMTDESLTLTQTDALHGVFHVIRRGKKEYALIEID